MEDMLPSSEDWDQQTASSLQLLQGLYQPWRATYLEVSAFLEWATSVTNRGRDTQTQSFEASVEHFDGQYLLQSSPPG